MYSLLAELARTTTSPANQRERTTADSDGLRAGSEVGDLHAARRSALGGERRVPDIDLIVDLQIAGSELPKRVPALPTNWLELTVAALTWVNVPVPSP